MEKVALVSSRRHDGKMFYRVFAGPDSFSDALDHVSFFLSSTPLLCLGSWLDINVRTYLCDSTCVDDLLMIDEPCFAVDFVRDGYFVF